MSVHFDKNLKMWVDIRRDVTGYGLTVDEARQRADEIEALPRGMQSTPPAKRKRYTLLSGVLKLVNDK